MGNGDSQFQISNAGKLKKMEIRQSDREYRELSDAQKEATRQKGTYDFQQQLDQTRLNFEDRRSKHQKDKKISSIRAAIRQKISTRVYEKYDRVIQSDETDASRKLELHHAHGTKLMDAGSDVLEIDLAGSSFSLARKEHTGFHGKWDMFHSTDGTLKRAWRLASFAGDKKKVLPVWWELRKQQLKNAREHREKVYGKENKKWWQLGFKYRLKQKTSSETQRTSSRYTISGPPLIDIGRYRIEGTKKHAIAIAQSYINTRLDRNGNLAAPITINIQGHSRGAVSAGITANEVAKLLESDPQYANCKHMIKINVIQRDPVPGIDSEHKGHDHKRLDLRVKDPATGKMMRNSYVNATSLVSFHADRGSTTFDPQEVRGQRRIVLMGEKHGVGLDQGDGTQTDITGKTKWHQTAGIDAATMKAYRGSGYSELGEGVWLQDEDNVLVRVRSYAQAMTVLRSVTAHAKGNQKNRHRVMAEMVKNWFIDNEFVDDQMRDEDYREDETDRERLELEAFRSGAGSDADAPFFNEMFETRNHLKLRMIMRSSTDQEFAEYKSDILDTYDQLIEGCKKYMSDKAVDDLESRPTLETISRLLSIYREQKAIWEKATMDQYSAANYPPMGTFLDWAR